jgi:hypothetical protein
MSLVFPVKLQKRLLNVFLILWALTTLAALAGMYHLWWTREHRLYDNRSVSEQRMEVFRRAGISLSLLNDVAAIDRSWPRYIQYGTAGNHNQLSYVKYLLLPRVPSGSDRWVITEKAGRLYTNVHFPDQEENTVYPPKSRGFLISLLLLLGVAVFLNRFHFFQALSLPEGLAAALLLLTLFTVLSRALCGDATFGFWFVSTLGICGGGLAALRITGCKRPLQSGKFFYGMDVSRGLITSRSVLIFMILITGLAFLWSVLMSIVVVPDDWDAWAIWGAKAKILALGLGPLKDVTYFDHADYPLLWPSLWAFSGWCAGGWEEHWSRAWGPVLMMLCAWEVGIIIHRLSRDIATGLFGAALFLSIPMAPLLASWSYAEAPLWLMMVCSFGYLLSWRKEGHWQHLTIAGLFAAAAAYTKNEGLFFAFLGFLWVIAVDPRRLYKNCLCYLAPLALFYLPWFWWVRGTLHLSSHAFAGLNFDTATISRAFHRSGDALPLIGRMWADIRQWNIVLWAVLILTIYQSVMKKHLIDLMIPLLMLSFSFVVIIFHQQEIFLLVTAWNRITTQTLPLFLVALVPLLFTGTLRRGCES